MNKFVLLAPLFAFFIGACGPANFEDELMNETSASADDSVKEAMDEMQHKYPPGQMPELAPPVKKLPTRVIHGAKVVQRLDPQIVKTSEERNAEREVHHIRYIDRVQPIVNEHTVNKQLNVKHRYFTKIREIPEHTYQRRVFRHRSVSREDMPEEVIQVEPRKIRRVLRPRLYPRYYPYFGYRFPYYGWRF